MDDDAMKDDDVLDVPDEDTDEDLEDDDLDEDLDDPLAVVEEDEEDSF
ncbi:hypothetical protein K2Y00_02835 [Patescibacteria group bacterium]|nr:hypothetical protein [Patescibacteria group bacterium]